MAVSVTLALMLLAAGPIYSDAVSVAAMRRSVTDVPAGDTTISVEVRTAPDGHVELDQIVTDVLVAATAPLETEITREIVAGVSLEVGGGTAADERVDVVELAWLESIDQHATLVDGSWPTDEPPVDGDVAPIDVAIDSRVAETFGFAVGDTRELPPRTNWQEPVTVRVVGIYQIDDATEPFWEGRGRFVKGVSISQLFRSARLVTTRVAVVGGIADRTSSSWLSVPRFERLELADIEPIRRRLAAAQSDLEERRLGLESGDANEFEVDTVVPALLARSTRSLTVARSAVFAVVAQFALLAGYALVLVAGLTVDARSSEVAMFRARGASSRQLLALALTEAVVIVVPAALIAPWFASWLLRGFDEFGPIASIGLELDPQPVDAAWIAVGLAAIVTIALLAWPAYRSARRAEQSDHRHARQRLRAGWQRAGVDVAVVALAAAAFWQLATLGDDRAASVRGRFGVDPLIVIAPAFGLIAGSLIALRLIPALGRLAERRSAASSGVVGALAGWQFARRPTRYARAALLVIMAVAIGTFSATYEATWTGSQAAQADHQVGADVRVSPNRRTGDSITDLHLVAAHEQIAGVRRSIPVVRSSVDAPGSDRPGHLVALDAARMDVDDEVLEAALSELAKRRPTIDGVSIPDAATGLALDVRLEEPEDPEAGPSEGAEDQPVDDSDDSVPVEPVPMRGELVATLRDGLGLLHQLGLGTVSEGPDGSTLAADLTIPGADDSVVQPSGELTIVDLELRTSVPTPPGRTLELEIGTVLASTPDAVIPIDLSTSTWSASTTRLQFTSEAPSLQLVETSAERGLLALLTTGSNAARSAAPVVFILRASGNEPPATLPVIAARSLLIEAELSIGDTIPVELASSETTSLEIVASVAAVSTVDPNREEALVVDLSTLQLVDFAAGRGIADVSEHWLELDDRPPSPAAIEATLGDVPIEATEVIIEERRRAELTSDPPALGAIGALTLGFIAAAVFALVGFLLTTVVSARERRLEFALLRALGLSMRQLRRWMLIEQVALIITAAAFGTVVGVTLARLLLPLVSLTQAGAGVYPPVEVVVPWRTIAGMQAVLIGGLLSSVVVVTMSARRIATSALLRSGGEA
jgi:hypothetical protein